MIHIQIIEKFESLFSKDMIQSHIQKTLDYLGEDNIEVSLVIEDNAGIHILNRDYRHIDAPTDVLSFAYDAVDPETNQRYIGDIIISGDKVLEQAQQAGHSHTKELCLLTIHGILHLCGYDHETEKDGAVMLPLQEKILKLIYTNES